jgi:hypothetical protein
MNLCFIGAKNDFDKLIKQQTTQQNEEGDSVVVHVHNGNSPHKCPYCKPGNLIRIKELSRICLQY